ncbi:hypothetical protein E4T39_02114 [Aureobasidium subglaciale]|nr:hypothetical protein E4T39_02114 [Aureobasidium subglaciale]
MTSTGMPCLILADGTYIDSNKIIGSGLDGYIVRDQGASTVMKIPKLSGTLFTDGTIKPDSDNNIYANDLKEEKDIYTRLDGVRGIANCLSVSTSGNGTLEDFVQNNTPPAWHQRLDWILQVVEFFAACHARRVLVFDIALRNLMLADDWSVRAIDFANSSLVPLRDDGKLLDSSGYTADVDILHVTNVIYSIACWKKFQVDCVTMDEWPAAETLPPTPNLPLGRVIANSWSHQFRSLDELQRAIISAASQNPIP